MTETARLVIAVDSSGADRATRSLDKLDRAAGGSERAANKLGKAWGIALGVLSSAVIAGATREYIRSADAMANMSAKLKLVAGSAEGATKAQRALFELSQRTSSDLEATTDLYVKLGQSNKDLAANSELLLGITEKVSKALVISGADAGASAAVIRQFSQAMAAGALRGDEFISVMEGAPRLAQAIADGMGVAVGSLRKLAAEGKLTSAEIIRALEDQGAVLDREFGEMPLTVSRATQQVRNALTQLIGDTDKASGASAGLAEAIADLARTLESQEVKDGFATVVGGVASITAAIAASIPKLIEWTERLNQGLGLAGDGSGQRKAFIQDIIGGQQQAWGALFDGDMDGVRAGNDRALAGLQNAIDGKGRKVADFSGVTSSARTTFSGVSGSSSSTANGAGATAATAAATEATEKLKKAKHELTEAEKDLIAIEQVWAQGQADAVIRAGDKLEADMRNREAVKAQIDDMQFELSLIGKSNEERAKAVALRYAGVDAASAEGRAIADLAVKIEEANEAEAAMLDVKRATSDLFADIISGSMSAGDAFEAFGKRLVSIAAQVIADQAMKALFEGGGQSAGGASGGGFWGSLVQGVMGYFGGGRAGGGPVMAGQSYLVGEHGPEVVTFGQNGRVSQPQQGGGQPVINFTFVGMDRKPDSTNTKRNGSGGFDVEMIFKQIEGSIANNVAQGASPINSAIQNRYNMRPAV